MGNCLGLQDKKVIKVMKTDGEILQYKAPTKVHQVLSEFSSGHAISDELPVVRHLRPDSDMLPGHLYYLLPPEKMVRNSKPEVETKQVSGVVRIKVVITKQELEVMLNKGAVNSVDDMISQLIRKKQNAKAVNSVGDANGKEWKPVLASIPEL